MVDYEKLLRRLERAAELIALSNVLTDKCERHCGRYATMTSTGPFFVCITCDECVQHLCDLHTRKRAAEIKAWVGKRLTEPMPDWYNDQIVWKDEPQAARARRFEQLLKGE